MNFTMVSPGDSDYNSIMMKKHLQLLKQRKQNHTQKSQIQNRHPNTLRNHNSELLPIAGQTLLNSITNSYNIQNNSSLLMQSPKKQVNEENQKMRRLIKENLQESLQDQNYRKKQNQQEQRKVKKAMSTENGVLDYLQREIEKRDNFIKMCLEKQQQRKHTFVDEDLRRHRNALTHIEQNYDADVFNHESDRYQQKQKINFQKVLETNSFQAQNSRILKQMQRSEYGRYLDQRYKKQKHNPITNPMQYHIQNPYLRKRIQKY